MYLIQDEIIQIEMRHNECTSMHVGQLYSIGRCGGMEAIGAWERARPVQLPNL